MKKLYPYFPLLLIIFTTFLFLKVNDILFYQNTDLYNVYRLEHSQDYSLTELEHKVQISNDSLVVLEKQVATLNAARLPALNDIQSLLKEYKLQLISADKQQQGKSDSLYYAFSVKGNYYNLTYFLKKLEMSYLTYINTMQISSLDERGNTLVLYLVLPVE